MPAERRDPAAPTPPARERPRSRGLFEGFPHGLVLVAEGRGVVSSNPKARDLLALERRRRGSAGWTCCELICRAVDHPAGADSPCLTERTLESDEPASEVEIRVLGQEGPVRIAVSVSRVDAEDVRVLFQLRRAGDESGGATPGSTVGTPGQLRVETLGNTHVEVAGKRLDGDWVDQRPGLLLKYLVCQRRRVAASDQIAEALWPGAAPREALTSLRHYVHVLRGKIEPGRPRRSSSSFIKTGGGGYSLDPEHVWIDAEELEQRIGEGLLLFAEGDSKLAASVLDDAMVLHRGEFLAGEAAADWLLEERERVHHLVASAYAVLVELELASGDLESAGVHARRLADLEPLDIDVQRQLIEICLQQGRRSDAVRRYALLRERTLREFGEEPGFTLADLAG